MVFRRTMCHRLRTLQKPSELLMPTPDNLLTRVRAEYDEMPGLRLTLAQACRLWQVDAPTCEGLLDTLIRQHFLARTRDGAFIAASRWQERPTPQNATLSPGATAASRLRRPA
jgi:hypothetical protein